jgi:hypothetical protein
VLREGCFTIVQTDFEERTKWGSDDLVACCGHVGLKRKKRPRRLVEAAI